MPAPKKNQYHKFRLKHGPNKKFTPEQLWKAACDYFQWCVDNPLIKHKTIVINGQIEILEKPVPRVWTIQGFCLSAGICQNTFKNYRQDDKDSLRISRAHKENELQFVAQAIANIIWDQQFQGAAAGLFNASIIARSLGLMNKVERIHKFENEKPEALVVEMNGKQINFGNI